MAFDIAAAKEAGYSDEEISAYQQAEAEKNKRATAITTAVGDPPAPTTIVPEVSGGLISPTGGMTTAMAVAAGAAGVSVPAAVLYGAKKIFAPAAAGAGQLAERGVSAIEESNQIARMKEQGLQQRAAARAVPQAAAPAAAPVRPTAILDQYGRPMQMQPKPMPPAPAPAPAYMPPAAPAPAAPAPSVIQRGTDIANQMRQYAAQRVIPAVSQAGQMVGRGLTAAAPALRVGGMASNALYSGGLNTDEQAELVRRRKMAPTISR